MAKPGGKTRDPGREKFWGRTIRNQQERGLSVRAFCLREGLKDWTFRWWRLELARRDHSRSTDPRNDGGGEPTKAAPIFVPVRVVDQEPGPHQAPPPIEIMLPTGPTVRVPCGF